MSTPYFNGPERIHQLQSELESWRGTPWCDYCAAKGRGADCVRMVAKILNTLSVIGPIDWSVFPRYPMDWSAHNDDPILERAIEALGLRYERVDSVGDLRPGDVLAFAPGRVVYHLGIFHSGSRFLHAMRLRGVHFTSTHHPVFKRFFRYAMRPVDTAAVS